MSKGWVGLIIMGWVWALFGCSDSNIHTLMVPPVLDMDFTVGTLPGGTSFTRNSPGTYYDANGLLKTAGPHVPRFDFDSQTQELRGLLIEEKRTNLLRYSEQLTQWKKDDATVTANAGPDPAGTSSATLVRPTASTNGRGLWQTGPMAGPNRFYTLSCFFKSAGYSVLALLLGDTLSGGSGQSGYVFDVSRNKTQAVTAREDLVLKSALIQPLVNGYYRCSLTLKATTAVPLTVFMQIRPDNTASITTKSDGKGGGYLWGAQLEEGPTVSSYIPTMTSAQTRETDLCLLDNVPRWFNPVQGTWVAETVLGQKLVARIVGYDEPSNFMGISPSTQAVTESWNNSKNMISRSGRVSGIVRHAMSYTATGRSITREGLPPVKSETPIGKVTQVALGANPNGTNVLNAHIRRIAYYPYAQPDSLLQRLTH